MHEYGDSIQEVVGTAKPPDGGFPYGDPCQDRESMALALGAVSAMAGRRASLLRNDARRKGFASREITQAVEHLQTSNPQFNPSTVIDVEQESNRQVAALGDEVTKLRRSLTAKRRCSIKDFWQNRSAQVSMRWSAIKGAISVRSFVNSGVWRVRDPLDVSRILTSAEEVLDLVHAFGQAQFDSGPVNLPWFADQVRKHIPANVPMEEWDSLNEYTLQDLEESIDAAVGNTPGPNRLSGELL